MALGFSGTQDWYTSYLTPAAYTVGYDWLNQKPMEVDAYCDGTCHTSIQGPGLALVKCDYYTWPINRTSLRVSNITWGITGIEWIDSDIPVKPLIYSAFSKNSTCEQLSGREPIRISTGIANYENCEGEFQLRDCTYTPAILEYDVKVQGHTLSFASSARGVRLIALANNTCQWYHQQSLERDFAALMLTGFLEHFMSSFARLGLYDNRAGHMMKKGPIEGAYASSFNPFAMRYVRESIYWSDNCRFLSRDPMDDMVAAVNELMFRAGLMSALWKNVTSLIDSGVATHQVVQTKSTKVENVFASDLRWFAGAATIQMLAIILLIPSFYGWWNIGVELSLSPFQMAKAFDSPLLESINSGAGATGIVKNAGHWRLRLGVVDSGVSEVNGKAGLYPKSRIGIDHSDRVAEPHKGLSTPY